MPEPTTVTVRCPTHDMNDCDCDKLTVEVEWFPGERNYGADMDGNRGIDLPGQFVAMDIPDVCPVCGHRFTEEQYDAIARDAARAAESETENADEGDNYADTGDDA